MTTVPLPAPDRPTPSRALHLADDAATAALGERLADMVRTGFSGPDAVEGGFTMHFSGDLGAGKTTAVRALLRRLGVVGRIKSPTYTLVEPYVVEMPKSVESRRDANLYCYHFDFYRFEDPQEWIEAGFREYFSDASLRLVEWPERARSASGSLLPPPDVRAAFAYDEPGRRVSLAADTSRGLSWLSAAGLAARSSQDDAGC